MCNICDVFRVCAVESLQLSVRRGKSDLHTHVREWSEGSGRERTQGRETSEEAL